MPRGADPEREQEYEKLVDEFHNQHRYAGREKEVASRIVNKQRSQFSETKSAREADENGQSPDQALPIAGYDHLDVKRIADKIDELDRDELRKIKSYETSHDNRKTLIEAIDQKLN